ncbi:MAG: hypothetical protein FWF25_01375 [Propionibacteriaceae bacterium]|nr:hypothetical protein [Propionibacteriaceae bacterium]
MNLNIDAIKTLALAIAGLLVVVAGLLAIVKGKDGQIRESAAVLVVILVAALIIAVGSHLTEVGNWLYGLLFG